MGRDKVLGLSLAILLVGFAAAFCFRNEPFVESGLKLARSKFLDEAIAQRPGPKPYIADAKKDRTKSKLPTVTLQGIESIEPFSDLQNVKSIDREKAREKATAQLEKKQDAPERTADRPLIKPTAEPKIAEIGSLTTTDDAKSIPVDSEKSPVEITTVKPAAQPAAIGDGGSARLSERLTSAEPPADDSTIAEDRTPSTDIVIRPNAALGGRTDTPVQQNVAWQSPTVHPPRDPIADNSPRKGASIDTSTGDDTPADGGNETRSNAASDRPNHPRDIALPEIRPARPTSVSPPSEPTEPPSSANYRIKRGDTLTKIALRYLGDSGRYREIFEANRDQLRSPNDRLKIGMTLRIPDKTAPPDTSGGSTSRRKSRSNRSGHAATGGLRGQKSPVHNAARVRETPPSTPMEKAPAPPPDDEQMDSDSLPTNHFVPVRKAPFLPPRKTETDESPPEEKQESGSTDMSHYRFFSRREPVRIAGDRDDAIVR